MITLDSEVDSYVTLNNSRFSYFAGNNYLGLSNHPEIVQAATDALRKYGVNFSASRQTTGTSGIHLELEKLLAGFKGQEDAVVFATGYQGNRLLLEVLRDCYDAVFADSQAHPSIRDGIPNNIACIFCYDHCDPNHLEDLLKRNQKYRPLIITDGIFALTGEIAPLDEIHTVAQKYHALVVTDDAHATGVLGKNGKGTPEHFGLDKAGNIFQAETMSKAFGVYGGFITAGKEMVRKIRTKSSFYGASTALPPPIVAAGCASVNYITQHPEIREKVLKNASLVRSGINRLGFETSGDITPIIPVFFHDHDQAKSLSVYLKENQIIVPVVDYPVKMDKYIVRITVSANHNNGQIENLLSVLKKWRDRDGRG